MLRVACRKVHICEYGIQDHGGQKPTKPNLYLMRKEGRDLGRSLRVGLGMIPTWPTQKQVPIMRSQDPKLITKCPT